MLVRLTGLTKSFRQTVAVHPLDLEIAAGDFLAILGPSGCGKTTLLRMMGGFETPTAGRVEIAGKDVTNMGPEKRPTNMVFQGYGLFPHMNVRQNVGYGLKLRKLPAAEARTRVDEILHLVHLEEFAERAVHELSGGQQQRVALARALVMRPAVLLLDEPLGALDKQLRDHMQIELKGLQREIGVTTIYVTHDQEEALTMSDRIAVMRGGRLEQVGTPREIYETPATVFVASFIGNTNLLSARALGGAEVEWGRARVRTAGAAGGPGASVTVALRPERIQLEPDATADNVVPTAVAHVVYQGETVRYLLRTEEGLELQAVELGQIRFAAGARVRAGWAAADARVLER